MKNIIFKVAPLLLILPIPFFFIYKKTNNILYLIVFFLFTLILFYFFRIPNNIKINNEYITSPANGTIQKIKNNSISIYLSLTNIHAQYSPYNGIILDKYKENSSNIKLLAFNDNAEIINPRMIHIIQTEFGYIKLTQISGVLANTPLSFVEKGQKIKQGEIIGFIKLGSRVKMSIYITNNNYKLKIDENIKLNQNINIGDKIFKIIKLI